MWLLFALITFFAWGAADLFYKKSNPADEAYSHLKTSIIVGLIMGAAAFVTLLTKRIPYDPRNLIIYLPVSSMYILSMTVGYCGLRYLELSVSSPIQNSSGAVSSILLMLVLHELPDAVTGVAIVLITAGVVFLGIFERQGEVQLSDGSEKKYTIGFAAFFMPVLYCILDSLGTFLDGWYLDDAAATPLVGVTAETIEDVANISYQLTFLIAAVLLFLYVRFIKGERIAPQAQKDRLFAALFETAGQLAYVYAMSGNGIAAAPVIAGYCVASLIFSRIFLKEKLSKKQYCAIFPVILGIMLLGVMEGLES